MKVGIIVLYCGQSGNIGYYNMQEFGLAKALIKRGCEVFIFKAFSDINEEEVTTLDSGCRLIRCPAKKLGIHGKFDWNIIKKYELDIVQVGADNQIFAPSLLRFLDKHNIKSYCYIGTIESDGGFIKKALMDVLMYRNIHSYKNHVCMVKTQYVMEKLQQRWGLKPILSPVGLDTDVIPNTVGEREILRKKYGIDFDEKVVLFVGRIEEYKRPFELIKLAKMLENKSVRFFIIGTGGLDDALNKEVNNSGLSSKFIWKKKITNTDIHSYYSMADYFVNFNKYEIFGMSILEAMFQGCTVIAFHAPGPDQIIEDGIDGFLVNDAETMSNIISRDIELNKDLIHCKIINNFTWSEMAEKILQL